jgi:telomere length regulation protein
MVQDDVKQILDALQSPISDLETLLTLLARPLESIGLLRPRFHKYASEKLPKGVVNIPKHLPVIQRALLQIILPSWESVLREESALEIADQFFCPTPSSSQNAGPAALEAYTTIVSTPFNTFSVQYLSQLTKSYPIQTIFDSVFDSNSPNIAAIRWEDSVRAVISIPTKVANLCGHAHPIPDNLQYDTYTTDLSSHTGDIIWRLSSRGSSSQGKFVESWLGSPLNLIIERTQAISYLIAKLVNIGVFPPAASPNSSQPSFFAVGLPRIRKHASSSSYQTTWRKILDGLPSSAVLQSIFVSLFSSVHYVPSLDPSLPARSLAKSEATLLRAILGDLSPANRDLWDTVLAVSQTRDYGEGRARILACWAALSAKDDTDSPRKSQYSACESSNTHSA